MIHVKINQQSKTCSRARPENWSGGGDQLTEGWEPPVRTDFRGVLAHIAERHLRLGDQQLALEFPAKPPGAGPPDLLRG